MYICFFPHSERSGKEIKGHKSAICSQKTEV